MSLYLTKSVNIPLDKRDDNLYAERKLVRLLQVNRQALKSFTLHKRSIDARDKSSIRFVCSYVVDVDATPANATPYVPSEDVVSFAPQVNKGKCVVVGAGPAGLFAALYLSQCGVDTTVVERGEEVFSRKKTVQSYFDGGSFNAESNVQFGLGGAGAFSDGKLTSGLAQTALGQTVFQRFVKCGAPYSILYDAMPHVGTDNLVNVVDNLRKDITANGGRFLFNTRLDGLLVDNNAVCGVTVTNGGKKSTLPADCVVLACGHSARDTFDMLYETGAEMRFKPFAAGLRIEHDRRFVNLSQYGKLFATHRDLSSASYKLTHTCADGHGCYTFCMCPGGVVVAANSEDNSVVVNGMSDYSRLAANSNSAVVVTVTQDDLEQAGYGKDVFSGVRFQQDLERRAYLLGGGNYLAPCQNARDFLLNETSSLFDVAPSYPRGVTPCNLRTLLPKFLADNLAEGLVVFDKKIAGFAQKGVLTGVETRTSSPLKILRDQTYQSNLRNLYPAGEGAGYAGGIVSSAVDGLRIGMAIANRLLDKSSEPK